MQNSEMGPDLPYLLFHPQFIILHEGNWYERQMYQGVYKRRWFEAGCFAIDLRCRRYPLLDVTNQGIAWTIWNIFPAKEGYGRTLKVKYVFGEPEQMDFETVRELYIETVCAHRWYGANGENQSQFRARSARYRDTSELFQMVGLQGHWPKPKVPKRASNAG